MGLLPVCRGVLFGFRQTALEDEVSVVRFAFGDLVVDRFPHHLHHAIVIIGMAQDPTELHQRRFRQHVVERHDPDIEEISPGLVDVHLGEAPQSLNRHDDVDSCSCWPVRGRGRGGC